MANWLKISKEYICTYICMCEKNFEIQTIFFNIYIAYTEMAKRVNRFFKFIYLKYFSAVDAKK